jgi:hypothetical protein
MSHYISSLVKLAERAADEIEQAFEQAATALAASLEKEGLIHLRIWSLGVAGAGNLSALRQLHRL